MISHYNFLVQRSYY